MGLGGSEQGDQATQEDKGERIPFFCFLLHSCVCVCLIANARACARCVLQILRNVEELNVLAGEGVAKIVHGSDGNTARLRHADAVPLKLYRNGFVLFEGPFRPYTDGTAQVGEGWLRGVDGLVSCMFNNGASACLYVCTCACAYVRACVPVRVLG